MLDDLVSGIFRVLEFDAVKVRERLKKILEEADSYIDFVNGLECSDNAVIRHVTVDSGFVMLNYLGLRLGIINTALLRCTPNCRLDLILRVTPCKGDEIERMALNLELETLLKYAASETFDLALLDGPLRNREIRIGVNTPILAHVKDVRLAKYAESITDDRFKHYVTFALDILEEPMVMFILIRRYREIKGCKQVVFTMPYQIRNAFGISIYGLYVQYAPKAPPIYVEYLGDIDELPRILCHAYKLASITRLGYPIPLLITDKASRVDSKLKACVKSLIEKLGSAALESLTPLILTKDVREYVKD